jgi:hypothetical protein
MPTINGSLVGFPPLQVQALKGTFASLTGAQTVAGAQTFTGGVIVDSGTKTAAATAGAATLNKYSGKITSEALTTAADADYTLTLTNSVIAAADQVYVSVANGTNTTEGLAVNRVQEAAGSVVIKIRNTHASSALNGTIVIKYLVIKA